MTTRNNAQHTPGPWRVGDAGHTVFGPPNGTPSPQTIATIGQADFRANARLIAAAPDGLSFAQNFRAWFADHFEDFDVETNAQLLCLDNEAAAFIAAATGREG